MEQNRHRYKYLGIKHDSVCLNKSYPSVDPTAHDINIINHHNSIKNLDHRLTAAQILANAPRNNLTL